MRIVLSTTVTRPSPLAVAPSLAPSLARAGVGPARGALDARVVPLSAVAILVAVAAGGIAQLLVALIGLITNLAFFGRLSPAPVPPAGTHLGWLVVLVPVAGGLLVGLMARYGSAGIRGHGIPEAMEQVLANQSRVPARLTILKPLSAAVAIGTGGPFGAEGPIIATGGALGSLVGQVLPTTAAERKTLLAAGAAAGMAATFGSPVAAVLLAVELLLFEYRPQSLIPVSLAAVTAAAVRAAFTGWAPIFPIPAVTPPGGAALLLYASLGAVTGWASVFVTAAVYRIEDWFETLPVHWMWWPALGAVAVGVIGHLAPRTLGVGYDVIRDLLRGALVGKTLLAFFLLKFVSWAIALGSGTSGGTLAPLFIIGGGLGATLGAVAAATVPSWGVDPRLAALVGMAAMFGGASRAFLASVVFAFETTRDPAVLSPLLAGGAAACLVSYLAMRDTIMTRKLTRRGVRVVDEYGVDFLRQVPVRDRMRAPVVTLPGDRPVRDVRRWIASEASGSSHQGFPVTGPSGEVLGVVTRRDLLAGEADGPVGARVTRPAIVIRAHDSLRDAADRMALERVGRLPVVAEDGRSLVGILTRSDLLEAHLPRLAESRLAERTIPAFNPEAPR